MTKGDPILVTLDPMLEPIFPRYLEIRQREQQELEAALADCDWDTLQSLGHRIKGSGSAYGLPHVTELGRAIEEAAGKGREAEVRRFVEELGDFMSRLNVSYAGQEG